MDCTFGAATRGTASSLESGRGVIVDCDGCWNHVFHINGFVFDLERAHGRTDIAGPRGPWHSFKRLHRQSKVGGAKRTEAVRHDG